MEGQNVTSDLDLGGYYQRNRSKMLRFIHARGITQDMDAEDVLHETFMRAHKYRNTFQGRDGSSLLTWLKAIALNVIRDQARLQKRKSQIPQALYVNGVDMENVPWTDKDTLAPIQLLEKILAICNNAERELFLAMSDHGGVLAAARALGLNPETAKVRVFRARKKIREACSH